MPTSVRRKKMQSPLAMGANDVEMIDFAGCGVAMGNALDSLKKRADLVTDAVDEDGIYQAFLKLHLI